MELTNEGFLPQQQQQLQQQQHRGGGAGGRTNWPQTAGKAGFAGYPPIRLIVGQGTAQRILEIPVAGLFV